MIRASKMCQTCPFRGIDDAERRELAAIPPEEWACHTEQGYAYSSDVQCRGHWEAQHKFSATQ